MVDKLVKVVKHMRLLSTSAGGTWAIRQLCSSRSSPRIAMSRSGHQSCVVRWCGNHSRSTNGSGVRYHRIPRDNR